MKLARKSLVECDRLFTKFASIPSPSEKETRNILQDLHASGYAATKQ
jgi:hypothetical protein